VKGARGNCLFGALYLVFKLRSLRVEVDLGDRPPHFYVVAKDGSYWHFRLKRRVLPPPFTYLWFRGRFEQIPPTQLNAQQ
jgi:hypothetical protein